MTIFEIQQQLRLTGHYTTPPDTKRSRSNWLAAWRYHFCNLGLLKAGIRSAAGGKLSRESWSVLGHKATAKIEYLGANVYCDGFEILGKVDGPVVYVANHMSMLETIVLPPFLMEQRNLAIVLKNSLMQLPYFGATFRSLDPIGISRRDPRADLRAVLEQGEAKLKGGASVLLFPQGTRNMCFNVTQFNTLGEKLSRAANVPMLPIALCTDFAPPGRILRDFGPVYPDRPIRFSMGPLIDPDEPRQLRHKIAVNFIAERLQTWGIEVVRESGETKSRS